MTPISYSVLKEQSPYEIRGLSVHAYSRKVYKEVCLALDSNIAAPEIIVSLFTHGVALKEILFILCLAEYVAEAKGEV